MSLLPVNGGGFSPRAERGTSSPESKLSRPKGTPPTLILGKIPSVGADGSFLGDLTLRLACQESQCGPGQRPARTHPCRSVDGFPEEEVKDAVKISLLIDSLKFPFQQVRGTEESVYSFVS